MPLKQISNYSGKTFVADLPLGWTLVPPGAGGPLEVISQAEFEQLKKEEVGSILINERRFPLFEVLT